jgi:hypothetical protein
MKQVRKWFLLIPIFFIHYQFTLAQTNENFNLEIFVEDLFNAQETEIPYEEFYESLLLLYQNPLNLNSVSNERLKNTYILSSVQIQHLQTYIIEKGKLITLYELQIIEGFDYGTIQKLLPFVVVDSKEADDDERPLFKRIVSERNNYLITRFKQVIEKRKGYTPSNSPGKSRYEGSPAQIYVRYRIAKPGDFSFGFTAEKDAGEAIVWDNKTKRYGMDYWSFHFMLERQGKFRRVIIGDFQLQFGQGLLFGAGFSVGKGAETINTVQRVSLGIRPYSSVLESGFMRGIAATFTLTNKINLTGFYSRLKQDANLKLATDNNAEEAFFSAIQTSGFHRTPIEIISKRRITEQLHGINIAYMPTRQLSLGSTIVFSLFDYPLIPGNKPYQFFEFRGKTNFNGSIYGNLNWRGFSFFGEAAISESGGTGGVIGLVKNLSPKVEFALLLRSYQKDFHTFRGTAFGENSRNINEKGVYWGFKYILNRMLQLTAYYDTFNFPWLRYRVNSPSNGQGYLLRINYNPRSNVNIYAQIRKKTKGLNTIDTDTGRTIVLPSIKKLYVISIAFNVTPDLNFKSKVQSSNFSINNSKSKGIAFIQDVNVRVRDWSFSGRVAIFDTEGGENRQYAYERDVLYAFSIPAYSGRGVRNYILVQYRLGRKIDLWTRIARTTYYDRYVIGSSLETIEGDKQTELKLQLRYKLG